MKIHCPFQIMIFNSFAIIHVLCLVESIFAVKTIRDAGFICNENGANKNISLLQRCNGIVDCIDKSDEDCSRASRLFIVHGSDSTNRIRIALGINELSAHQVAASKEGLWEITKNYFYGSSEEKGRRATAKSNPEPAEEGSWWSWARVKSYFKNEEPKKNLKRETLNRDMPLQEENTVTLEEEYCKLSKKVEFLYVNESHIYLKCESMLGITEVVTIHQNHTATNITIPGNITSLKMDTVTKNFYILENSTIKLCDSVGTTCTMLMDSKENENPTVLAFSSKYGYLFYSIVKEMMPEHSFIKKCDRRGSSCIPILQGLTSNLTQMKIDEQKGRLYWKNSTHHILSSKFDGTDVQVVYHKKNTSIEEFTVSADHLYWKEFRDFSNSSILECNATNCIHTARGQCCLSNITAIGFTNPSDQGKSYGNPCGEAICSHLCTYTYDGHVCYCQESDSDPYLKSIKDTSYCQGRTLLLSYGPDLYVIGLSLSNPNRPPVVRKTSFVFTISSMTYDSVRGNVILANRNTSIIYTWSPQSKELKPISDQNNGTITSLDFDDVATIFWINKANYSINNMNLDTSTKTGATLGNESYVPLMLTLAPNKGSMFVLFLNKTSQYLYITVEKMTITANYTTYENRTLLHEEKLDTGRRASLNYNRHEDILCLCNDQVIKCMKNATTPRPIFDGVTEMLLKTEAVNTKMNNVSDTSSNESTSVAGSPISNIAKESTTGAASLVPNINNKTNPEVKNRSAEFINVIDRRGQSLYSFITSLEDSFVWMEGGLSAIRLAKFDTNKNLSIIHNMTLDLQSFAGKNKKYTLEIKGIMKQARDRPTPPSSHDKHDGVSSQPKPLEMVNSKKATNRNTSVIYMAVVAFLAVIAFIVYAGYMEGSGAKAAMKIHDRQSIRRRTRDSINGFQ